MLVRQMKAGRRELWLGCILSIVYTEEKEKKGRRGCMPCTSYAAGNAFSASRVPERGMVA